MYLKPFKQRASSGFSLIEAVFALLIIALGTSGLLTLFSSLSQSAVQEEPTLLAIHLAGEKLEQIANDKASTGKGYSWIVNGNYPSESIPLNNLTFTRSINITEVDGNDLLTASPGSGLKRVQVTVTAPAIFNETISVYTLLGSYL